MSKMAEHRVSVLSASLRRYEDPAKSADPRIRRLVAGLRTLEPGPPPRAHFRAELRAQLVAVAPRLIAEGTRAEEALVERVPGEPSHSGRRTLAGTIGDATARLRTVSLGRPVAIVTAIVAVFALLLGGAVWVSKKALPGDALYALKRANENVQLSLTSGGEARGKQYLSLAATRVDEVSDLLHRSGASAAGSGPSATDGISSHTANLVISTLSSANSDVRNAAQLLGGEAVRSDSTGPLDAMIDWAPGQIDELQKITDRLPAGDAHDSAVATTQLVTNAQARAQALRAESGCACLDNTSTDDLGPVPCPVCASPAAVPGGSTSGGTSGTSTNTSTGTAKATTTPEPGSSGAGGATGSGGLTVLPPIPGVTDSTGGLSIAPLPLPTVTLSVPNLLPGTTTSTAPNGSTSSSPTCVLNILNICI
jgi:hypothetical protein